MNNPVLPVKILFCALFYSLNNFQVYSQEKPVKVTLDYFFNNERRINPDGKPERFHYIWEETDLQGFSLFGKIFTDFGASLSSLATAPTLENLDGSDIYIIVDPDNKRDNPNPNIIGQSDINVIKEWVHSGGVLVLMANDSANCDLVHINILAENFGISFSDRSRNMVKGNDYEVGAVMIPVNQVFKNQRKAYLKEISILDITPPAMSIVSIGKDAVMAVAKYGKGSVFAVGDPWLYNEYIDNRIIPYEFENYLVAKELVQWLLLQAAK